jgi:hypothetical protein
MFVCGENVAKVSAVEDVFEGGKNADPDGWTPVGRNEPGLKSVWGLVSAAKGSDEEFADFSELHSELAGRRGESSSPAGEEKVQPGKDGQERQEELSRDGHEQRDHEQRGHARLDQGSRSLTDGEGKDGQDQDEEVLTIVDRPSVGSKGSQRVGRLKGRLERREGRCRSLSRAEL